MSVDVELVLAGKIGFAAHQNAVPVLRELRLTHSGLEPLVDLSLTVTAEPAFVVPRTWHLERLDPKGTLHLDDRDLEFDAALLGSRDLLSRRTERPTTFGWGPRFLHSTGQYHKGGPAQGVFLQVTSAESADVHIPDRPFTFGTLIASGVPILESLDICRDTAGNVVMEQALTKVRESIQEGGTIAEPLGESGIFDDIVTNMIDVGEETGELDKMLIRVADNYDDEVDVAVTSLTSIIEPVLIIFLGAAVFLIVLGLFTPLLKLIEGIEQGAV